MTRLAPKPYQQLVISSAVSAVRYMLFSDKPWKSFILFLDGTDRPKEKSMQVVVGTPAKRGGRRLFFVFRNSQWRTVGRHPIPLIARLIGINRQIASLHPGGDRQLFFIAIPGDSCHFAKPFRVLRPSVCCASAL